MGSDIGFDALHLLLYTASSLEYKLEGKRGGEEGGGGILGVRGVSVAPKYRAEGLGYEVGRRVVGFGCVTSLMFVRRLIRRGGVVVGGGMV